MRPITTTVELTLKDVQRVTSIAYRKTAMAFALGLLLAANILIFILWVAIVIVWTEDIFDLASLFFFALLAAGIGIPAIILLQAYFFKAKRIWRGSNLSQNPITYTITPNGVGIKNHLAEKTLNWEQLFAFEEDKRSFYLHLPAKQFIVLPKRYLNENEVVEIRKLLYTKLERPKRIGMIIGAIAIIILTLSLNGLFILISTLYLIQGGLR